MLSAGGFGRRGEDRRRRVAERPAAATFRLAFLAAFPGTAVSGNLTSLGVRRGLGWFPFLSLRDEAKKLRLPSLRRIVRAVPSARRACFLPVVSFFFISLYNSSLPVLFTWGRSQRAALRRARLSALSGLAVSTLVTYSEMHLGTEEKISIQKSLLKQFKKP